MKLVCIFDKWRTKDVLTEITPKANFLRFNVCIQIHTYMQHMHNTQTAEVKDLYVYQNLFSVWYFTFQSTGPSGYITGLYVSDRQETNVTISWKPLECYKQNGPAIAYGIRLYKGLEFTSATIAADSQTSYTLYNLVPCWSGYAFSVALINEVGVGDYSPPLPVAVKSGKKNTYQNVHTYITSTYMTDA